MPLMIVMQSFRLRGTVSLVVNKFYLHGSFTYLVFHLLNSFNTRVPVCTAAVGVCNYRYL